jgi:hydrogenase expression/formation protein HypE
MRFAVTAGRVMPFECPLPLEDYDAVTLAHGGGGRLMHRLIEQMLVPGLDNEILRELHDGAFLGVDAQRLAFSTDSFVVHPVFFPGGDIGSLAVHGTTNDLAMCGARPRWLSLAFILEEGFLLKELWQILLSIRTACDALGVVVVTGDTKVVERGKGDGIYVNTSGVGEVLDGAELRPGRVRAGDRILVSGPIAQHGMAILSVREELSFESQLVSDSAALWPLVEPLLAALGEDVHVLRDPTRGGVASAVNEIAQASGCGIVLDESSIPVDANVRAACEILGFDPLYVANEGRLVAFVSADRAEEAVQLLREHPLGRGAQLIGEVVAEHPSVVRLRGALGGSRVVDMLSGEQLPRIC